MRDYSKHIKYISLSLLMSLFAGILSKYLFEQALYKHRDLTVDIVVNSGRDFTLVFSLNQPPGLYGSEIHTFEIIGGQETICQIPLSQDAALKRVFMFSRPKKSSFVIGNVQLGGFYRGVSWNGAELKPMIKSHSREKTEIQNFQIIDNKIHVNLDGQARGIEFNKDWTALLYKHINRDSRIFGLIISLLFLFSFIIWPRVLLFWAKDLSGYSVIFSACFLILIFVPFFSENEIESSENRTLAKPPNYKQLIWKIPAEFNRYFEDHFPFRNQLAQINNLLRIKVFNTSPLPNHLRIGKDGWLFMSVDEVKKAYQSNTLYTEKELSDIRRILEEKEAYLKKRGIDFYFVFNPLKHAVYPEYLPKSLQKKPGPNKRNQVLAYLNEHSHIKVIDPFPMMIEKKDSVRLFYKTDTHWNQLGGFFTYQMIMRRLAEDHPMLSPLSLNQYNIKVKKSYSGDMLAMINLYNVYYRDSYHLSPKFPSKTRLLLSSPSLGSEFNYVVYENENDELPRLLMFRDSYADYLRSHMSNHFSYAGYSWTMTMEVERIKKAKPDIVIYEMMERFVERLLEENPDEVRKEVAGYYP